MTIFLVWLGHVTVTGAELFQSAGHWGFMSELSDPERRGEYQGAAKLGGTAGGVWAPALFTFLAMTWGAAGWIAIAAIIVLATLAMGPAARAAERYLAEGHRCRARLTLPDLLPGRGDSCSVARRRAAPHSSRSRRPGARRHRRGGVQR